MGGGAIRTAAKVAGITAATGGIRSVPAEHYSLFAAGRKAASGRSVAAVADDVKLVASNSESGDQRPCLEFDDWVFPVMEEQVAINGSEAMPRVVFHGLPTHHEAKQATSELSVALEKAYLSSPNSVGSEGSVVADHDSNLPRSKELVEETKGCVTSEILGAPVVPAPAIMAFKFLHESPVAKEVVASIACDPNVWNAVLQNQELQRFMESQKPCKNFSSETVTGYGSKSVDDYYSSECAESEQSYEVEESKVGNGFQNFFQKMKRNVVDMLSSLSDYLQDLFGGKDANNRADVFMERSFMGLAVMAILVILLKRA